MKTIDFIKIEDFPLLIPCIEKFAARTDTPFYQHVNEVSASLMNDNVLTIVGKDGEKEGKIVAYLCGFYLNKTEFMVSQVYSEDAEVIAIISNFLDDHLRNVGILRIIGLSKPRPDIFEKYGYKVERYVVVKTLKKEGD